MPADPDKKKRGRPKGEEKGQVHWYLGVTTLDAYNKRLAQLGMAGTEFGRRVVEFFLSCPVAIQLVIVGRGDEVTDAQWSAIARLIMPDDDEQTGPAPIPMPKQPKGPQSGGGASGESVIDKLARKRLARPDSLPAKPHLDPALLKDVAKPKRGRGKPGEQK